MARQKQRSQLSAIGDINMTPLIDLTFLLLIVFMITVPLLEFGVDVSPPEFNADPLPDEKSKVINLQKDGQITFDKKKITLPELKEQLIMLFARDKKLTVLVRADGSRKYEEVMNIMKTVREAGIKTVSLVTQAEQ